MWLSNSSPWIAVIPILTAECDCKYPRIIPARGSLKLFIGNVKGKDVFNDQLVGRFAHRLPLRKKEHQPTAYAAIEQTSSPSYLLQWSYLDAVTQSCPFRRFY
jgi:hypothetical protein